MEAHPTPGLHSGPELVGLGLTNHRQKLCELQCPNGSFPSFIRWEQNWTIGIGPCVHPTAGHSGSSLWSSEEGPTAAHMSLCGQTLGQRMWGE